MASAVIGASRTIPFTIGQTDWTQPVTDSAGVTDAQRTVNIASSWIRVVTTRIGG